MSFLEEVVYKNGYFDESPIVICRLQRFMCKYLSEFNHPSWFQEALRDLYGNSFLGVPKFFFYEEDIDIDKERPQYVINMIDKCITKLRDMGCKSFIDFIREESKGNFFEIRTEEEIDEKIFEKYYVNTLIKVKSLIIDSNKPLNA